MFRMIEKQLVDAVDRDIIQSCGDPCTPAQWTGFGPHAKAVLAEILGSIPHYSTDTIKPVDKVTVNEINIYGGNEGDTSSKLGTIKSDTSDRLRQSIKAAQCDALTGDWYCCLEKGHAGVHATTRSPHGTGPVRFVQDPATIDHSKTVGVPATDTVDISGMNPFSGPLQYMPAAYTKLEAELKEAHAEIERLTAIIHQPEMDYFLKGVSTEAEYQREIHEEGDADKTPAQWVACITYLASKALQAIATGSIDKAKHHIVTTAACCKRWHSYAPEVQNDEAGERPVQ